LAGFVYAIRQNLDVVNNNRMIAWQSGDSVISWHFVNQEQIYRNFLKKNLRKVRRIESVMQPIIRIISGLDGPNAS
jgi:hypothetical protein